MIKYGELEGMHQEWNENGQKYIECSYKKNKREGLYQEWYEDGQKCEECYYKEGKQEGLHQSWWPNGKIHIINNYKEGISRLIREPDKHINFAIDKWWFNLQGIHNWYLITPLTVTQREDYSDIEKRSTNYSHLMLDLNKEAFFKAQAKANKYKPKLNIFS
jgi:hypothetical protein